MPKPLHPSIRHPCTQPPVICVPSVTVRHRPSPSVGPVGLLFRDSTDWVASQQQLAPLPVLKARRPRSRCRETRRGPASRVTDGRFLLVSSHGSKSKGGALWRPLCTAAIPFTRAPPSDLTPLKGLVPVPSREGSVSQTLRPQHHPSPARPPPFPTPASTHCPFTRHLPIPHPAIRLSVRLSI